MKSPLLSLNIYSHSAIIYCSSDKKGGGGVEEVWLCHVKNLPDPPLPPRWQLTGSQFSIAPPPPSPLHLVGHDSSNLRHSEDHKVPPPHKKYPHIPPPPPSQGNK